MKSNNTGKLIVRLFVFVISLVLVGADLVSSAQNANSGTTPQEDTSTQNSNTSGMNMNSGGRRRRRGRRSGDNMNANAAATTDANTSAQENANTAGAAQENANTAAEATGNANMGGGRRRRGRRRSAATATGDTSTELVNKPIQVFGRGRCDPMTQEQTDLSGTYAGTINYTEGGLTGDATLTISGNDFTLTGGSSTVEGRIVAVTTCNYTAATMRFGKDATVAPGQTPPPPLPTVSLRARRTGGGLVLETVPGESRQFSFRSTRTRGGMRHGGMKGGTPPVGIKPPTVR